MDANTVTRLIEKSRQTCTIVGRSSTTEDENENPIFDDGTPSDPIPCLFLTPQSFRRAEISTATEEELSITHQIYLPGDTVIDRNSSIADVLYDRGLASEVVLASTVLEVVRLDTSLRPLIIIGNLHEVS